MLNYIEQPNPALEALAYLGRRAAGQTWDLMEQRLTQRRIALPDPFRRMLDDLRAVTARLDKLPQVDEGVLTLFRNLEGFPRNTVGTGSPAFLLFYGTLGLWNGDISAFTRAVIARSRAQTAWHMALAMDMEEECNARELSDGAFLELVLSSALPDATRMAVLDTYHRAPALTARILPALTAVLEVLEEEQSTLDALSRMLGEQIGAVGCEAYLTRTSRLTPVAGTRYQLRPFLFGMDTSLTANAGVGVVQIYCGIGRDALQEMLTVQTPVQDDVYSAFRLLGDRTRFDILCYLRSRSAYGQELCNHFGLSRNTIHHHMNKLARGGLVRCATDGNRIYYSLDHSAIARLLQQQKWLFEEEF